MSGSEWRKRMVRAGAAALLLWSHGALAQPDQPDQGQEREEPPESPEKAPDKTPEPAPASPAPAKPGARQPSPASNHPAHALFEQARLAIGRARGFSFHLSTGGSGKVGGYASKVDADVWMSRTARAVLPGWRLRMKGSSTNAQGVKTDFDVAWLESTIEWSDDAAKLIKERVLNEARQAKPVSAANLARFDEFQSPQAFAKELAAEEYAIEDRASVGGVLCEVILAKVNQGRLQVRWWLGVDDHLPRKSEAIFTGNLEGTKWSEVTNLKVFDKSQDVPELRVPVPADFSEDRKVPPAPKPSPRPTPQPSSTDESGGKSEAVKPEGGSGGAGAKGVAAKPVPLLRQAPGFELTDAAGGKVSLESLRGKVVVAEFGGTWSLGIAEARREFQQMLEHFKDQPIVGLSIAVREKSRAAAIEEYRKGSFDFRLLLEGEQVARQFEVAGFPSYVVIGPGGEIIKGPTPYKPTDTFKAMTEAAGEELAKLSGTPAKATEAAGAKSGEPTSRETPQEAKPASAGGASDSSLVPPEPRPGKSADPAKPDTKR